MEQETEIGLSLGWVFSGFRGFTQKTQWVFLGYLPRCLNHVSNALIGKANICDMWSCQTWFSLHHWHKHPSILICRGCGICCRNLCYCCGCFCWFSFCSARRLWKQMATLKRNCLKCLHFSHFSPYMRYCLVSYFCHKFLWYMWYMICSLLFSLSQPGASGPGGHEAFIRGPPASLSWSLKLASL